MGREIEIIPDFLSEKQFWPDFLKGKQKSVIRGLI